MANQAQQSFDPMNPDHLLPLLARYAADKKTLTAKVAEIAPTAEALDRLATPREGSRKITETAKLLQVRPKDLFDFMQRKRWIYRRPGMDRWIAYQSRIQAGELEHKLTNIEQSDGSTSTMETVLVTPAGRVKLARLLAEAEGE
ncbi:phage antirepressor KilAC domain-containing protein [Azospirillum agricola]|uniref:phage antirepressor KilAC domain-containing protein n=1 Tax=Azospirillum agricola TaxID=1720247 RepID=UPI000A1C94A4|nr:phage antirepressor KilAC domain-containing protein [Azospirillum agricola]